MPRGTSILVLVLWSASSTSAVRSQERPPSVATEPQAKQQTSATHGAQRFANVGTTSSYGHDASRRKPRPTFDQGLTWLYAFNHDEAIRSFLRAAELDPKCAMAWWGVAYCEGPNYNDYVMTDDRSKAAWYALQNAVGSQRARGTRGTCID